MRPEARKIASPHLLNESSDKTGGGAISEKKKRKRKRKKEEEGRDFAAIISYMPCGDGSC